MTSEAQRELAARIRADRQVWRDLVAEVGRERMLEPGPMGEWTFKDMAAHLAAWRNARIPMIEAIGRGDPAPRAPWPAGMADDDAINDWFRKRDRGRALEKVLDEYDRSFERLAAAIEALPDDIAHDPDALPWAGGTAAVDLDFTDHLHGEHLPDVRAWLARRDGAIIYVDRSAIRPGKVEELIAALGDLAALVESHEDQIVSYQAHLDEARASVSVVQIHGDAASLDRHLEVAGPSFPRFAALVDLQSIDVYGTPSESAIAGLRRKAELLGHATVTVHPLIAGFARLRARVPDTGR